MDIRKIRALKSPEEFLLRLSPAKTYVYSLCVPYSSKR